MHRLLSHQLTTEYFLLSSHELSSKPNNSTAAHILLPCFVLISTIQCNIISYSHRGTRYPEQRIFAKGDESLSQCKQSRLMVKI